jgi:hypothetical protein
MAVWRDRRRADLGDLALMSRRFPPPWTVEQTDACFIAKDHTGHSLAYVYFEEEPGRRVAAHLLTRDDARRIAAQLSRNAHSTPKPSNIPVRVLLPSSENGLCEDAVDDVGGAAGLRKSEPAPNDAGLAIEQDSIDCVTAAKRKNGIPPVPRLLVKSTRIRLSINSTGNGGLVGRPRVPGH